MTGRHLANLDDYWPRRRRSGTRFRTWPPNAASMIVGFRECRRRSRRGIGTSRSRALLPGGRRWAGRRGNRVNGLITPCRPMSPEAVAGKNPSAMSARSTTSSLGKSPDDRLERAGGRRRAMLHGERDRHAGDDARDHTLRLANTRRPVRFGASVDAIVSQNTGTAALVDRFWPALLNSFDVTSS